MLAGLIWTEAARNGCYGKSQQQQKSNNNNNNVIGNTIELLTGYVYCMYAPTSVPHLLAFVRASKKTSTTCNAETCLLTNIPPAPGALPSAVPPSNNDDDEATAAAGALEHPQLSFAEVDGFV